MFACPKPCRISAFVVFRKICSFKSLYVFALCSPVILCSRFNVQTVHHPPPPCRKYTFHPIIKSLPGREYG